MESFALSASELVQVLNRYYPTSQVAAEKLSEDGKSGSPSAALKAYAEKFGTVVVAEPVGDEISVDHQPKGHIPSTLRLSVSLHLIIVRGPGHADWGH